MIEKKRYHEIDLCRGLGIILVVLGHSLKQTGTRTPAMNVLLDVIYSFHMPLFFLLSGFTALKILELGNMQAKTTYIIGRARRLLIPYFVIGVLYIPLKFYMSKYAVKPYNFSQIWKILIGENPNTALWFVYILFLCSLVSVLILNRKNLNLILAASFVLSTVSCFMDWSFRLPKYYFFFVLGIVLRSGYDTWKIRICRWQILLISCISFTAGNIMYHHYEGAWFMLTAVTGSILFLGIANFLSGNHSSVNEMSMPLRWLHAAGTYSMDIYIFSEPVMTVLRLILWNILGLGAGICTLLCFLGALIIPIPVSLLIVRKIRIFRLLFLGM